MELIGVGFIAAGLSLWAAMPTYRRRGRRKELGLPPKVEQVRKATSRVQTKTNVEVEDWRNAVPPGYRSGGWSGMRYYGVRRRP